MVIGDDNMRRGTTLTHTFTLPFTIEDGVKIRIVYAQNEKILVEHTEAECQIEGATISTRLSSEETLRFDCRAHYHNGRYQTYPVEIQVGIMTSTGEKAWSNILETTVERCLRKDGVI